MSKNVVTIVLCGVCLLLGILLMKSCDKQDQITQRYQDSVKGRDIIIHTNQQKADEISAEKDSIAEKSWKDSAASKHRDDSLMSENKALKRNLHLYQDSATSLWGQLRTDYFKGDTAALRLAYYGLKEQLDSANSLMMQIQFHDQAIEYNLRTEADSCHATIRTLYAQMNALKSLLDQQTQIAERANQEEGDILAAQKKKKIWELLEKIGIGLAGIFIGKKL